MNPDLIDEIVIDDTDRLRIKPRSKTYPMIYREALEVRWDAEGKYLYSPMPREWSYFDWFRHIIDTADPGKTDLALAGDTRWINIPDTLRHDIEEWMAQRT